MTPEQQQQIEQEAAAENEYHHCSMAHRRFKEGYTTADAVNERRSNSHPVTYQQSGI